MEDFNFWWYIIAAVIYFLTRGKKKKQTPKQSRPGSENNPQTSGRPKTFEELLREITEGSTTEAEEEPVQEPEVIEPKKEPEETSFRREGRARAFADDESKRIYEESIKMAEGADLEFAPDENFKSSRLFKDQPKEETTSFAAELMDGFDADEAKKAVIYAEIFNRKY